MSLILDALRKSEAERRRGQAPDLFAPVAARIAPSTKPRIVLLAIVAIILLAAAAALVFWPEQPARRQPSVSEASTTETPSHANIRPLITAPATTDTNIPAPKARPVTPIETANRPLASKPTMINPPAEISAASTNPPTATGTDAVTTPLVDTADAADADTIDNEPALPTLATLDSTTRAALPPLQLSMHVWNPDATRRFAIIDGQRLGEGGKLAGVVVAEIRRDGVVLDIDGRQYLLPRP
jgi:general secretion pathway protein B